MKTICLTSNEYINCIEPFSYYWNRAGGVNVPVEIVCYDLVPDKLPPNFSCYPIGNQADYSWSSGLIRRLEHLSDPLVLLMLEDYFLTAARWDRLFELVFWMQQAQGIGKIDLSGDRLKVDHTVLGADLILSEGDAPYLMSLQAALWRRDFLLRYLNPLENAWQAEKHGTGRVHIDNQRGLGVGLILGTRQPVIDYGNAVGGAGNKPGVIEPKHMPSWMWDECVAKGWAVNG